MCLKYVIFLITAPLFSQAFFTNNIDTILISSIIADDIQDIDLNNVQPYVYEKIPNLTNLSVNERKAKFINLILPAILIEKHKIQQVYNYILSNFDILHKNDQTIKLYDYCKCNSTKELLMCFTEQPNSIIIAQAAIESGWGTSRFFLEGFNLFGIHSYNSENQIKAHNSSLVYVKKYNSISESISHYLRTLARVSAYSEFREKRATSKDVMDIIDYLISYSERRELYIDDLKTIIEYNKLYIYDNATLQKVE